MNIIQQHIIHNHFPADFFSSALITILYIILSGTAITGNFLPLYSIAHQVFEDILFLTSLFTLIPAVSSFVLRIMKEELQIISIYNRLHL